MSDNKITLDQPPVQMKYKNWRGETSVRTIIPISVRYGNTEWHPEMGWLMLAFDVDKQAEREFALKDADFTDVG
ncbi:hypothetical protein [Sulfitobacter sp. R18_1]|uniref:hypothetical protein n=1 Tax=Sulfitobacter sp. R18_1 TaxID=2821104 RepID=UPI001ADBD368|nr:hypothetical protein [Sulfitobacter sp. R18_1]MBO9428793.1 hypothetical protein [Sulfitobacter sp. R18_1]